MMWITLRASGILLVLAASAQTRLELVETSGTYDFRARTDIRALAFDQSGQLLAISSDTTLHRWDPSGEDQPHQLLRGVQSSAAAFSRFGKFAAVASPDGTVEILDTSTGIERIKLTVAPRPSALALSADGGHLLVVSESTACTLISLTGARRARKLTTIGTISAAFLPHDELIALAMRDGTIRILGFRTGRVIRVIATGADLTAFATIGNMLLVGSRNGSLQLWHRKSGHKARVLRHGGGPRPAVLAFSEQAGAIAVSSGPVAKVLDCSTGAEPRAERSHTGPVNAISIASTGAVASVSDDGTVRIWRAGVRSPTRSIDLSTGPLTAVSISPRGDLMLTGARSGGIFKHSLVTAGAPTLISSHQQVVAALHSSDDANSAISAGWDGIVKRIELHSNHVADIHHSTSRILAASVTRDLAVAGREDGVLDFISLRALPAPVSIQAHNSAVYSLAIAKDGSLAVSGSRDGETKVWRVADRRIVRSLSRLDSYIASVAFSPDQMLIALCAGDGSVRVFNSDTGALRGSYHLPNHDLPQCMVFTPDGAYLLIGTWRGVILRLAAR